MTESTNDKQASNDEAEAIAEDKSDDAVLPEGESEDDKDVSVTQEAEDNQLAEATIISEETSDSDDGLEKEQASGEDGVETDISENDEIKAESADEKGLEKSKWWPQKFDIAANKGVVVSGLVVGLLAMVLFHGIYKTDENPTFVEPEALPVQLFLASVDGENYDSLYFDRFLILLEEDDEPAYLMLSIVVMPSNRDTYEEVNAKKTICRSIIYEVLQKSVTQRGELKEPRKILEQEIMEALNQVLATGALEQVNLYEFLVV